MKKTIITVASMTYAFKARKLLQAIGIKSNIIKVNMFTQKSGCNYGIEFDYIDFYTVIRELKSNDISYAVYSGG